MPRKRTLPDYVKRVTAKGRVYHYFDTGIREGGKPVYTKLPDPADKLKWGGAYAAALAARTKRLQAKPDGHVLVPQLVAEFLDSPAFRRKAPATQKAYRIYLERLCAMLPTAPAAELAPADVTKLMDKLSDKPGAANMLHGAISGLYKWGRERHRVTNNPTQNVRPLPMGEHEPWSQDTLNAALSAEDAEVRLAVHLLYFTAQRIGDVCRMRWDDLTPAGLVVTQQKTRKPLLIPIHPAMSVELARAPRQGATILADRKGRPRKIGTLRDRIQAFAAGLGAVVVPHGLRKNAVIALLEAGCSAAEAAAISGQSLQLVEHYAKLRSQVLLGASAMRKWASGTGIEQENG